jgi:hypothetical protein
MCTTLAERNARKSRSGAHALSGDRGSATQARLAATARPTRQVGEMRALADRHRGC